MTNFDCFKEAPWFKPGASVIVGGAGGIGSWLSFFLARLGCEIYLFDNDLIEHRNLGGQLYGMSHVGKNKAVSMKEIIAEFSGNKRVIPSGFYDESSPTSDTIFSGFDNMKARKIMFDKWEKYQLSKTERKTDELNVFIDGRLTAETAIIYAVKSKNDCKKYRDELFDDDLIPDESCSYRSTSHNAAMIASLMVAIYNNYVSNRLTGDLREVPFKLEYELPLLSFRL